MMSVHAADDRQLPTPPAAAMESNGRHASELGLQITTLPSIECLARIGPYEIGKKLGEGSFAMVRLGKHLPTGEEVHLGGHCLP